MKIKNTRTKNEILLDIYKILCEKNHSIESLTNLFVEYTLYDLKLSDCFVQFDSERKNTQFSTAFGSFSPLTKKIRINIDNVKKSPYELFNTLAHELKHMKDEEEKKDKVISFPISKLDRFIYYIYFSREDVDLFSLEYSSHNERNARVYALELLDRFVEDIKNIDNEKKLKFLSYIYSNNQKEWKKEEKKYQIAFSNAKKSFEKIRFELPAQIKRIFISLTKEKPNEFEETVQKYFKKEGTVKPFISAFLPFVYDEKLMEFILSSARKNKDEETIKECLSYNFGEIEENAQVFEKSIYKTPRIIKVFGKTSPIGTKEPI